MKSIDFYIFTGTGNTLLVVKKMKEVFESYNIKVSFFKIEKTDAAKIEVEDKIIGLAFPVAVQGTYPFVWDFIKNMPKAENTKVFMVDTLGMFSGGIIGPVKKILKKKGYNTIGAKEIIMPSNFFTEKNKDSEKRVLKGLKEAEKFAIDIINQKSKWHRIFIISDIVSLLSKSKRVWNSMRKIYTWKLDSAKCTKCNICVKLCPVNNIVMNDYPVFGKDCTICMRCISFCPTGAIYHPKIKKTYKAVKVNEILNI